MTDDEDDFSDQSLEADVPDVSDSGDYLQQTQTSVQVGVSYNLSKLFTYIPGIPPQPITNTVAAGFFLPDDSSSYTVSGGYIDTYGYERFSAFGSFDEGDGPYPSLSDGTIVFSTPNVTFGYYLPDIGPSAQYPSGYIVSQGGSANFYNSLTISPASSNATVTLLEDAKGNITGDKQTGSFTYVDTGGEPTISPPIVTSPVASDQYGVPLPALTSAQSAAVTSAFSYNTGQGDAMGSIIWSYNPENIDLSFIAKSESVSFNSTFVLSDQDNNEADSTETITIVGPSPTYLDQQAAQAAGSVLHQVVEVVEAFSKGISLVGLSEESAPLLAALKISIATLNLGTTGAGTLMDYQTNSSAAGANPLGQYLAAEQAVTEFGNQAFKSLFVTYLDTVINKYGANLATLVSGDTSAVENSSAYEVSQHALQAAGFSQAIEAGAQTIVDTAQGMSADEAYDKDLAPVIKSILANAFQKVVPVPASSTPEIGVQTAPGSYLYSFPLKASPQVRSLDPFGNGLYFITTAAGSPAVNMFTLPISSAGGAYSVSFEQAGGAWSAAQTVHPFEQVGVPEDTSSIRVQLLNADGSVDSNPSNLSFFVTFASSGTANVTVNAPTPDALSHSSPLYVSQFQASQTGELSAGAAVTLKLNLSEAVTVDTPGGMPTLSLDNGATAAYDAQVSNPSQGTLAFDYTVGAGDTSPNLYVNQVNLNGATVVDANGNAPDFADALYTPTGLQVGSAAITSIHATPPMTNTTTGQNLQLTVSTSQGLTLNTVGGTPTLSLSNGATATYDASASSPSSGDLVFDDLVGRSDYAVGLAATGINLNGATLTDASGVAADLSPANGFSLGLDVNAAVVTSFAASRTGQVAVGAAVTLALATNEAVAVDTTGGAPTLTLDDGATATYDAKASDPGQGKLVFDYTVGAGDQSPNLQAVAVNLNGATIDDANGNPADLSNALYDPTGLAAGGPVCFAGGTRIRVMRDGTILDVPVEALCIGDLAVTASGAHRPIRWLGHRSISCAGHPEPWKIRPVRIAAHAFGAELPARELHLSPGHPVLVGADGGGEGGQLVPIMCLINGTSIARAPVDSVTYWHVELDTHDILLAEGMPAESFLDWGNRLWFEDGADHALTNPDFIVPGLNERCRPVAIDGQVVEAERRRLDALFATSLAAQCAWPTADANGAVFDRRPGIFASKSLRAKGHHWGR